MIRAAGWLYVLYGAAHTVGALTVEGAGRHAGAWFSAQLWHEDFSQMSPAGSALWLSVDSFGIPLVLLGASVLWLDRRGLAPPPFIAWVIGIHTVLDAVILPFTPWPVLLAACVLLVVGARRQRRAADPPPPSTT